MADTSAISWCDHTHNHWIGCTKISPACKLCYAATLMDTRYGKVAWGPESAGGQRKITKTWGQPLSWARLAWEGKCSGCKGKGTKKRGRRGKTMTYPCPVCGGSGVLDRRARVFCGSLMDIFEDWDGPILDSDGNQLFTVSGLNLNQAGVFTGVRGMLCSRLADRQLCYIVHDEFGTPSYCSCRPLTMADLRRSLFKLIDATPELDWLLLTKRPESILDMWDSRATTYRQNVWIGCTVENQEEADKRLPHLKACRNLAPVLFTSCEPLLGPIEFGDNLEWIDWVIDGGESGNGARLTDPRWYRLLQLQCEAHGVAYHHKQNGEWVGEMDSPVPLHTLKPDKIRDDFVGIDEDVGDYKGFYVAHVGKKAAGRKLFGKVYDEFPEVKHA